MAGAVVSILQGNALDINPEDVAPGTVLITDPPYSPHVHSGASTMRGGVAGKRDLGFEPLTGELRQHLVLIGSKCRWSVIFCDWEGMHLWREAFNAVPGYRAIRAIPWIRWSMPQLSGDRPPQGSECILIAAPKGELHWNGPGNLTHFDEKCERGGKKHATAKPLDLMLRLVSYFSDPGELVLDPCCGRGTTCLAAQILGRDYLGVEIQEEEVELAKQRLLNGTVTDAVRLDRFTERSRASE